MDREERRKFWLLKPEDINKQKTGKIKKDKKQVGGKVKKDLDQQIVKIHEYDEIELTPANISKKITDICASRAQMEKTVLKQSIRTLEYILENEKVG